MTVGCIRSTLLRGCADTVHVSNWCRTKLYTFIFIYFGLWLESTSPIHDTAISDTVWGQARAHTRRAAHANYEKRCCRSFGLMGPRVPLNDDRARTPLFFGYSRYVGCVIALRTQSYRTVFGFRVMTFGIWLGLYRTSACCKHKQTTVNRG